MRVHHFCMIVWAMHLLFFAASCNDDGAEVYAEEISDWRAKRIARLAQPRGWSSLTGLYWLPEGTSSFGSADTCGIVFPGKAPEVMGFWILRADSVILTINPGVDIRAGDSLFQSGGVRSDAHRSPDLLNWQSLYWMLIRRDDNYGVRLWDTASQARRAVQHIPYYPVDRTWRLIAEFHPADAGETVTFENVTGSAIQYNIEGRVVGTYRDTTFSLAALDGGEDALFLIFSDATTDLTTYPGGRYLYTPRPDATGSVIVDFNKAYNPPCAFTDFATCLLPPPENYVPLAIRAGEKDYGEH